MKFCYLDESGTGDQPVAVMVGVVADATRMHLTKDHWAELLDEISGIVGQKLQEFHAHKFYRGSGIWKELDGNARSHLIDAIIRWMKARKHKIVYSAIDANKFKSDGPQVDELCDLSMWKVLGLHVSLALQRAHQREAKNKGHTVLVFDEAVTEKERFTNLLLNPPQWTDGYYDRSKKQVALDQLIDVPHFVNSKHVSLVQVADLYAFLLRRYFEIESELSTEAYAGETKKVRRWAKAILDQSIGSAHIFPRKGASEAAMVFQRVAPTCCL